LIFINWKSVFFENTSWLPSNQNNPKIPMNYTVLWAVFSISFDHLHRRNDLIRRILSQHIEQPLFNFICWQLLSHLSGGPKATKIINHFAWGYCHKLRSHCYRYFLHSQVKWYIYRLPYISTDTRINTAAQLSQNILSWKISNNNLSFVMSQKTDDFFVTS